MVVNKKRKYDKPSMKVYELKHKPQLLVGSGVGDPNDYDYGGNPLNP